MLGGIYIGRASLAARVTDWILDRLPRLLLAVAVLVLAVQYFGRWW